VGRHGGAQVGGAVAGGRASGGRGSEAAGIREQKEMTSAEWSRRSHITTAKQLGRRVM